MSYNARYYDPVTARFTQPDTIVPSPSDPQALNRYSYVNNNPTTFNDPTGHCIGNVSSPACETALQALGNGQGSGDGFTTAGRPEAVQPWWVNIPPFLNLGVEIRRANQLYAVEYLGVASGADIPGDALQLIFLQESGYWLYGVDELANQIGRNSYGPMSMRPEFVADVWRRRGVEVPGEAEIIDLLTGDPSQSYFLAGLFVNDMVDDFGLDAVPADAEFRTYMAYSLSTDAIEGLNAINWNFTRLGELEGFPTTAVMQRAAYYQWWDSYLADGASG